MFAAFTESARSVRGPLFVGYSMLFTAWVSLGEQLTDGFSGDPLGQRLLIAGEQVGSATEFALLTALALAIGSFVLRAGLSEAVGWLQRLLHHPDWDEFIDGARAEVRRYEERSGRPSAHWAQHLQDEVDLRSRLRADSELRLIASVAVVPPLIALGLVGGGWWVVALLAVPIVLTADLLTINRGAWAGIRFGLIRATELQLEATGDGTDADMDANGHSYPLSNLSREDRIALLMERLLALERASPAQLRSIIKVRKTESTQAWMDSQ